jgi:hypothetical protein
MTDIVANTAGYSNTEGTADYVVEAESTGKHQRIDQVLTDGQQVEYYCELNSTDAGFEQGVAIWRSSTSTLEVQNVLSSSNGGGKVFWAAVKKILYIVTGRSQIKYPQSMWYSGKEAIVILSGFDSNAAGSGGYTPAGGQTYNANVFCYASSAGQVPYSTSNLGWYALDPTAANRENEYASALTVGNGTYTGQILGDNGNPAMAMGDAIQKATGIPVYIFQIARGGTRADYWGAGAGLTDLSALLPDALAAVPGAPTYADIILCSVGANDAVQGYTAEQYYTNWGVLRSELISGGWWDVDQTQYIHIEIPDNGSVSNYPGWMGLQYMLTRTDNRVSMIGIANSTYDATFPIHFLPPSYTRQGRIGAAMALVGPAPFAGIRDDQYVEKLLPVLGGDMDAAGFDITDVGALTGASSTVSGIDQAATQIATTAAISPLDHGVDAVAADTAGGAKIVRGGDGTGTEDGGSLTLAGGTATGTGDDGYTLVNDAIYGGMAAINNAVAEAALVGTAAARVIQAYQSLNESNGISCDVATGWMTLPVDGL